MSIDEVVGFDPSAPTLRSLFVSAFDKFADRTAVVIDDQPWTYGSIATAANQLGHRLLARGIAPGQPVALMLGNTIEYVIADQALHRIGAARVPLNELLADQERQYILRDCGATVAITGATQHASAKAVLADPTAALTHIITTTDDHDGPAATGDGSSPVTSWAEELAAGATTLPDVEVRPDHRARMTYTGGTTGRPKGVVHLQGRTALNTLVQIIEMGLGDDETMLFSSPLPHAAGTLFNASLIRGAMSYVEQRFDLDVTLDRIERDGATFTFMVPTMIYRLLDRIAQERTAGRHRDLSSLHTILYGAAPITLDRLTQGLDLLGPVFMQLYGQTEAPNWITRLRREDHRTDSATAHRLSSCGQAATLTTVAVFDDEDQPVPNGTVGEIVARTPYTMVGYHGLPEATAKTLRNGWLHTGDLGYLDDDGYVYLVDRKNDMIISGGMNVYSTEVENCLASHDSVAQVAVVGVPHEDWGEAVVAYVVAAPGQAIDEAALADHARTGLAAYRRPKAYVVVDDIPTTSLGKPDKKRLRTDWPGW